MPAWLERRLAGEDTSAQVELPASDAPSVALFLALGTQWRRHGMTGMRLGIDYTAIEPTARLHDIATSPAIMADIRLMEGAALDAFAERERRR